MSSREDKVGVAVVGCGHWGQNLVRNFSQLGALSAVVDADMQQAARLAAEYGVSALTLDAALADDRIHAIATAVPAALHHDVALRAIHAGKHVFVEKPIALSLEDGEDIQAQAILHDRVLMVGHLLQYHPAYLKMQELIAADHIGELRHVYSNRLSMGRLRQEEDVVWSFAPHDISMILGLAAGNAPSEVLAHGCSLVSDEGRADAAHVHMRFCSGLRAHVFVSWLHPFKEQKLVAIGERGCLVFDDTKPWDEKLVCTDYSSPGGVSLQKGGVTSISLQPAEPLQEECRHFLQSVALKSVPRTDGFEALAVLRVLKRAELALREGVAA
ncbi:Gfo/Idh/MocA family oxidoreductase [Aureimonas fodinaquatilis]|uniref:Gfo/Idh/MocA family oxidoreductase n=1 Tax=Aureimonas fodinaquatilis TaxID=2565783 RepID=A0A5B0DYG8_9HYPH|nr:Gfo/Idh/MocA family oxidoreductase [Aureimonas fodinaquatilis]KAA0971877.1 Gfo/Idh/MocA family oxidoreductase [Aureimonas fodinaquatilis]